MVGFYWPFLGRILGGTGSPLFRGFSAILLMDRELMGMGAILADICPNWGRFAFVGEFCRFLRLQGRSASILPLAFKSP